MKYVILSLVTTTFILGCKKENGKFKTVANINVVNAVIDLGPVKVNPTGDLSLAITDSGVFGAAKYYYASTGAAGINIVAKRDSTRVLVNNTYNLESAIYTMYIAGTTLAVDTIFRLE